MKNVPAALVPYVCVLIGIIGNLASDAASVMVPPLAAMAFMGVGKHPVAGMICGYIGAQVGYAANPVISGTDTAPYGDHQRYPGLLYGRFRFHRGRDLQLDL